MSLNHQVSPHSSAVNHPVLTQNTHEDDISTINRKLSTYGNRYVVARSRHHAQYQPVSAMLLTPHATGASGKSPPVDGINLLDRLVSEVVHAKGDVQKSSLVLFALESVEPQCVL